MAVPVHHPLPVVEAAAAFPPFPVVAAVEVVVPLRRPVLAAVVEVERLRPLVLVRLRPLVPVVVLERRSARLHLPASRATCGHTWRTLRCDLSYPKLQL